jgi:hypothetical protein
LISQRSLSRSAITSAPVTGDREPVRWLCREDPDREEDSGWRVFAGDESPEYADDPRNAASVPLRELIKLDPALEALIREPDRSHIRTGLRRFVPAGTSPTPTRLD